jgi:hypothetical protein
MMVSEGVCPASALRELALLFAIDPDGWGQMGAGVRMGLGLAKLWNMKGAIFVDERGRLGTAGKNYRL